MTLEAFNAAAVAVSVDGIAAMVYTVKIGAEASYWSSKSIRLANDS